MEGNDNATPLPTSATPTAGSSRPGTRTASVDPSSGGPALPAKSPLLRQPRSPSVVSGSPVMPEPVQVNKRRPSVFMRRQSLVPYALSRLVKSKEAAIVEPSAAQLAYSARNDSDNPYRTSKDLVLKQFYLWNGLDVNRLNLPPLPVVEKPAKNIGLAWNGDSQAVRQLGNLTRNGPRHFTQWLTRTTSFNEAAPTSTENRSKADAPAVQKILHKSAAVQPTAVEKTPAAGPVHQQLRRVAGQPFEQHPGAPAEHETSPLFLTYASTQSRTPVGADQSAKRPRPGSTSAKSSRCASICSPRMSVRSQAKLLEKLRQLEQRRFLERIDGFIEEMRRCAPLHTIPKKAVTATMEALHSRPTFSTGSTLSYTQNIEQLAKMH